MTSQRTIWAWRVAGLALAMMLGVAVRRITSHHPAVATPPSTQPHATQPAGSTTQNQRRFPGSTSQATDRGLLTIDPTPQASDDPQPSTLTLAYSLARTESGHALELAAELPPGQDRDDLISYIAAEWAAKTPEAAAEWANQIADTALRERVLAGIAAAWAETNPTAAADWALKSLGAGKPRDDAIMSVIQRWTQQKPDEAAAWVAEFPAGALRDTAVEELVKLWTDQNLEAAGNWVGSLGLGVIRDTAVGAYVNKIVFQFPATAAQWAKDIQDDTLRSRELETVGASWMTINPDAARTWIAAAPLSEATKARLLAAR